MTEIQAGFGWSDRYLLGYAPMDDTHREFVTLVDALLKVPDAELEQALTAFAEHAVAHFDQEDRWMRGSDFPATDCHVDEHARVLVSVREVQQELAKGHVDIVRKLAQALMNWFPGHADYLDSALAAWMVKRSHGGKPVVFRRDSAKA